MRILVVVVSVFMKEKRKKKMENQNNLINEFISLTGGTINEAQSLLESTNFNLENAINLFFECSGNNNINNANTSNNSNNNNNNSIYKNHFEEKDDDNNNNNNYYNFNYEEEEEYIRAPIPSKRQQLLPQHIPQEFFDGRGTKRKISSVFNSLSRSSTYPLSSGQNKLIQIFKPPTSIMFPGPFLEARNEAKKQDKWMLINIQRDEEFLSHVLNRDVWSDEGVQDLVKCNFLFWQKQDDSPDGKYFIEKYTANITPPCRYPYVCIINPITGLSLTSILTSSMYDDIGPHNKDRICEKLQDFLSSRSTPSESIAKYNTNVSTSQVQKNNSNSSSQQIFENNTSETSTDNSYSSENQTLENSSTESFPFSQIDPVQSSQSEIFSLVSNGFNGSDIQKIIQNNNNNDNNLTTNSSNTPTKSDASPGGSKIHPSSIIRLIFPSGFKYDYIIQSQSDLQSSSTTTTIPTTSSSIIQDNLFHFIQTIYSQIPNDSKNKKFDMFYGFPPLSLYSRLCELQQNKSTPQKLLSEVLSETKLSELKLGGEKVTIRYIDN